MSVRTSAALLGLGAGLAWILGGALGWGDDPVAGTPRTLWLVGFAALLLAAALAGYALVATAPPWLRIVVTAGSVALAVVVVSTLAPDLEASATEVLLGGVLVGLGGASGLRAARRA